MWSAAILAGGLARRLGGQDKSALIVDGVRLLDRQLATLRPLTETILLVGARVTAASGCRVVEDLRPGTGALGALYTALACSPTPRLLVLAADMPFVTRSFLDYLAAVDEHAAAVVPVSGGRWHPLCAMYRASGADSLAAALDRGERTVRAAVAALGPRLLAESELAPFDPLGYLFANLNTPDDLARWGATIPDASAAEHGRGGNRYCTDRVESNHETMILPVHDHLRTRLSALLSERYGLAPADQPAIAIDYPPNRALGDLALPVAFELARRLRKAPKVIARELAESFGAVDGVAGVEATPTGYLNCFLDRPAFLLERVDGRLPAARAAADAGKTIVEHTAINPNKAAHIGHLRNAALGDTLVRVLRFRGVPVEVQNYIDDTGVQVADVVVGFRTLEGKDLDTVRRLAAEPRFDVYCWDLYAKVTEWYEEDKARLEVRLQALHEIEHGDNATAEMGAVVADAIVRRHLVTMGRLGIGYDLLTWEGDILRLEFWARAFEILKRAGTVYFQTEGRLKGCWVMAIDEAGSEGATPAGDDDEEREKVIVRSNGTVTYVGKDIAYQFWKFGLLGLDFRYRPFVRRDDGPTLWATTTGEDTAGHPTFGGASTTYNVIDVRQSYLQKLLKQALAAMGHTAEAERSVHFSYEMVALSHQTARELGYETTDEDSRKPFVEVSGRKGLGVKADDLIDLLERTASSEVARRNPDLDAEAIARIGSQIAVAAVRYFMIKYSRGKVIAFDIGEALSFEGESGPYLQYAVVRANNIFSKLKERLGLDEAAVLAAAASAPADALSGAEGDDMWGLVLEAARLDEIVEQVVRSLEFSVLAKYAFGLAQAFNGFYHRASILNEERDDVRTWRAAAVAYVRLQLTRALDLMGIAVPVRM